MDNYLSLNEASKLTGKSVSWVRIRAKKLEKQGRATKKTGSWKVEREALIALNINSKKPPISQKESIEAQFNRQLLKQIDDLKEDKNRLIDEVEKLNSENFSLRAELKSLLENKSGKGLKDIVSRWIRI